MIYKESITPKELESFPLAKFKGEITLVEALDKDYYDAVGYLSNQKIVGFDTETKPCFTANTKKHSVALLQLSGKERVFLFRLHNLGLPKELAKILSSSKVHKVGAAIHDDIKALQELTRFSPKGFVDLQSIVINWGITEKSVRKLAGIILGVRVSKSQQLSNWEAPELSLAQLNYAAVDAWVCQKMYLKLLSTPKPKAVL